MLKLGVDLRGLHPVWGIAYPVIQQAYLELGYPCLITSANDGKHGPNSLHYKGMALDFRTKHIEEPDKLVLVSRVKERLGAQFDVVFESHGLSNEHLHVEFDPKDPPSTEI